MAAVHRHVLPNAGVTEIRVHGVGGTTPEALLEQTGITQVTGDDTAGFFRGTIDVPGRTVEAYSWGGLTSRSRSRAFWVLLLPFSMVNLAGWMVEPPRERGGAVETSTRTPGTRTHEAFVHLVAVAMTAMYVLWVASLAMNTMAFQCAAIDGCRDGRWYLEFLGRGFFQDAPGRRVVLALAVPMAVLGLFYALGQVSRSRYDEYGEASWASDDDETGSLLGRRHFWSTGRWQAQISYVHIAVVLSILAGLLGRASMEFERRFGVDVVPDIGAFVFWAAAAVAALAVGALFATAVGRSDPFAGSNPLRRTGVWLLAGSAALLAVAVWLTWSLDVSDDALTVASVGGDGVSRLVPVTDLWGFGWAPILLLAVAVAFVGGFSAVQIWRWLAWSQVHLDQMSVVVALAFIAFWDRAPVLAGFALLAALAVEVTQRFTRRRRDTGPPPESWRLGVYLLTVTVGSVVWVATRDAAAPYGHAWPRLTPLIAFTVMLALLGVVRLVAHRALRAAVLAAVIPASIGLAGFLLSALSERPDWRYAAFGTAFVVVAVVWLAQQPFDGWRWNGPAATALLGLSITMGVFSGGALRLADFLDRDETVFMFRATAIYEWLNVGFVLLLGAGIAGLVVWMLLVRHGAPPTGDGTDVVRTGAEALAEGIRALDVTVTMVALTILTGGLALVAHLVATGRSVLSWIDFGVPEDWAAIVDWASWITLAIVLLVFAQVRSGLRDPAARKRLGVLWDVASFWPRNFHPFAPPAYATRAVPELQARLLEVADTVGEDGRPARVILSAHSQGTVVALVALATLPVEVRRKVCLVTHGSPLRRFYQRFFPRYFPNTLLTRVATTVGPTDEVGDGGWLNFWRSTDPIGDPVFRGIPERTGTPPAGVVRAIESGSAVTESPDFRVLDPVAETALSRYQVGNHVRGHSGYMADPAMSGAIDEWAAHLGRGSN